MELFLSVIQEAWRTVPFPVLLVYLIALGLLWLFVEYQLTRISRSIWGWRRSVPLTSLISQIAVWGIRLSWWFVLLWLALFVTVAGIHGAELYLGYNISLGDYADSVARVWQQTYRFVNGLVPGSVAARIPGLKP